MGRIIANMAAENIDTKPLPIIEGEDELEADADLATELDFAELHALFEIQYKQLLTDTSDEIAKRAKKLLDSPSQVYWNSRSG